MNFFKFFYLLFFISILSCTGANKVSKEYSNFEKKVFPKGNITLLEHQLRVIDYLHKNPKLKGILVNHYMGTGKTLLGIGIAESYPERPVIILAPRFLESTWRLEMEKFGVKNPERYEFVSYKEAPRLLKQKNTSEYIILADEVHNLVKNMHTTDTSLNASYAEVYANIRKSYKVIGLTGTPVFSDESDIAYLINLVSGKDLLPFNQEKFRLEYTTIEPTKKYFRGYLSESNFVGQVGLPISLNVFFSSIAAMFFPESTVAQILFPVGGLLTGVFTPVIINQSLSLETYKLRELNVEKMGPVFKEYVSFFKFDESTFKDFPAIDYKVRDVPYNRFQYSFFLHLIEGDLPSDQLKRLLQNDLIKRSDDYVKINSTLIHDNLANVIGSGRDIGNFDFRDKEGKLVEPPKFLAILDDIEKHDEQTVIYSNYYETGILAFEKFLKRQKYNRPYGIIHPNMSLSEVSEIVKKYNQQKIKLLLLHPEITEGISLMETQHLHLLEPMLNGTVMEQVIGRTRRFKSHSNLPKDKQTVHVNMWKSTSSTWDFNIGDLKRANWYERYNELNYMSRWGIGIRQIDKKADQKALNPDEAALLKLQTLNKNLIEMQKVLTQQSIESKYNLVK